MRFHEIRRHGSNLGRDAREKVRASLGEGEVRRGGEPRGRARASRPSPEDVASLREDAVHLGPLRPVEVSRGGRVGHARVHRHRRRRDVREEVEVSALERAPAKYVRVADGGERARALRHGGILHAHRVHVFEQAPEEGLVVAEGGNLRVQVGVVRVARLASRSTVGDVAGQERFPHAARLHGEILLPAPPPPPPWTSAIVNPRPSCESICSALRHARTSPSARSERALSARVSAGIFCLAHTSLNLWLSRAESGAGTRKILATSRSGLSAGAYGSLHTATMGRRSSPGPFLRRARFEFPSRPSFASFASSSSSSASASRFLVANDAGPARLALTIARSAAIAPFPSAPPVAPSISSITTQLGLLSPIRERICVASRTRVVSASALLSSDAFTSTTRYPAWRAATCANVVLPTPGAPHSKRILCWGRPSSSRGTCVEWTPPRPPRAPGAPPGAPREARKPPPSPGAPREARGNRPLPLRRLRLRNERPARV